MATKRLSPDIYTTPSTWHIVIHARESQMPFADGFEASTCVRLLEARALTDGMSLLAFCVMPDHVHLLLRNLNGEDVAKFVRHFKQVVGHAYKQRHGTNLWQRSFFDRAIRKDTEIAAVAHYIVDNPVKSGLAERIGVYPFAREYVGS